MSDTSRHWPYGRAPYYRCEYDEAQTEAMYAREEERLADEPIAPDKESDDNGSDTTE